MCDPYSPSQVGAAPLQVPSAPQVLVESPVKVNPSLQEYVATLPNVVDVKATCPFSGSGRDPQSMKMCNQSEYKVVRYMRNIGYRSEELIVPEEVTKGWLYACRP